METNFMFQANNNDCYVRISTRHTKWGLSFCPYIDRARLRHLVLFGVHVCMFPLFFFLSTPISGVKVNGGQDFIARKKKEGGGAVHT